VSVHLTAIVIEWYAPRLERSARNGTSLASRAIFARGHAECFLEHAREVALVREPCAECHVSQRRARVELLAHEFHPQAADERADCAAEFAAESPREVHGMNVQRSRDLVQRKRFVEAIAQEFTRVVDPRRTTTLAPQRSRCLANQLTRQSFDDER